MNPTTTTRNIETVQTIYDAFQRGDVAAILERVAENVDWNNSETASGHLAWNGDFSGRKKLPGFFTALAEIADFQAFEPIDYLQNDRQVAVHLRIELTLKKNGRQIRSHVIHLWTFDERGCVTKYRHFNDTAAELAAWQG